MRTIAVIFKMPAETQILNWERIYYEEGLEALYINRLGRKPKKLVRRRNN